MRVLGVIGLMGLLALALRCGRGKASGVDAVGTELVRGAAGRWRDAGGSLALALTLTQRGDSVSGTGTYARRDTPIGCGGETLPSAGALTVQGHISAGTFDGWMRFDNGWSPPYVATLAGTDTLQGHFMSVDRGPCALVLVRER